MPESAKGTEAFRTISEAASELDVPQHVLRFWETRFAEIRPLKRGGGRRYYRPEDVELLRTIRHLLYGEGYTIRGVQRLLKEQGVRGLARVAPAVPQPVAVVALAPPDRPKGDRLSISPPAPVRLARDERLTSAYLESAEPLEPVRPAAAPVAARADDGGPQAVAPPHMQPAAARPQSQASMLFGPDFEPPATVPIAPLKKPAPSPLGREAVHRLQAALSEIDECRRILALARGDRI